MLTRVAIFAAILLVCPRCPAEAQDQRVNPKAVLGEPNAEDDIRAAGVDHINAVGWVDNETLVVFGDNFEERFVRCLAIDDGEELWHRRFEGEDGSASLSVDGEQVMVEMHGEPETREGLIVAAEIMQARTGEPDHIVLRRDIYRATRRDEDSHLTDIRFGPIRNGVVVVFSSSEEDEDPRADRGDGEVAMGTVYGTRAYLYDWRRKRVRQRYAMDPYIREFAASPDTDLLGYVGRGELLCVYDSAERRDRVLAGEHHTEPGLLEIVLDAPFYSGIQISNTHAVVARDNPQGLTGQSQLFVINLTNGQVEARIETLGGHIEFDVDFERERIAVTGSAGHLGLYNFAGDELHLDEDATTHRNHAIAFSPDGSMIAMGGDENTVHLYEISAP